MGLILFIILGALVGYIASRVMGRDEGFIASTVIGVVGAVIGEFIAHLFNKEAGLLDFNGTSLAFAFVGALLLVYLLNKFSGKPRRTL